MSVTIRLARIGRKNLPAYKIVVSTTRDKRNGKFIDILGHYNPSETPVAFEIDKQKFEDWKNKGALISQAVKSLIANTYEYQVYDPKGKKAKKTAKKESNNTKTEELVEETQVEEVIEETSAEETKTETKEEPKE